MTGDGPGGEVANKSRGGGWHEVVTWPKVTSTSEVIGLIVFSALATVAEMRPVQIVSHGWICLSYAFSLGALMLFGTGAGTLVSVIASGIADARDREPIHRIAFNMGQYAVSTALAGWVFYSLRHPGRVDLFVDLPAIVAGLATYFLLNLTLISAVIALSQGSGLLGVWFSNFRSAFFEYFTLAPMAPLMAFVYEQQPIGLVYLLFPVIVAYYALQNYSLLRTETQNTIQALADAIDKRDPSTFDHSRRVAALTVEISRKMGLPETDIEILESAARVHDLGKVTIDNSILQKPGGLDAREWETVRKHPRVGADLVAGLSLYRSGLKIVLGHHERYDGKGYPAGLAREEIPLGARIIAVADSYDAMTQDRPYRKAMSPEVAMAEIERCTGTQFDPRVVEAFLALMAEKRSDRSACDQTDQRSAQPQAGE